MAETLLYEGDRVILYWGQTSHTCTVHRSNATCAKCGGSTVRIEPPWETWQLLCCRESALTITSAQFRQAVDALEQGAIGLVSQLPVRLEKED